MFDAMFDLVDTLTFTLRQIPASMWIIYELTYKLFKTNAIDFLDGELAGIDGCNYPADQALSIA